MRDERRRRRTLWTLRAKICRLNLARAHPLPSTVVVAELGPVLLARPRRLGKRRRVFDLVLRPVDEDGLRVGVDAIDDAGGENHLLAEDPGTRVDDDVAGADLVAQVGPLADL